MLLPKLFFGLIATAAAAPSKPPKEDKVRVARGECVQGKPVKYGGWTIEYSIVESPKKMLDAGYIIDPRWRAKHETVDGPVRFHMGAGWIPYADNMCQYTCNANKDCVSFASYSLRNNTYEQGEVYCHFFDQIIDKWKVVPQDNKNASSKLIHGFNKLCDQNQ